jgi:oligoribonuclease NrnB/cAMP/cGMP phosphodiesterase (DHH superfamily)
MNYIKDIPKVYLVTLKVPRPYEKANNVLIEKVRLKYSNVILVDWHRESVNIRKYFATDWIHLTGDGMRCYTNLLLRSL